MIIRTTNMWNAIDIDLMLVTTNGYIAGYKTPTQHLVMGRGAALESTIKYKDIAKIAASTIISDGYPKIDRKQPLFLYGMIQLPIAPYDAVYNNYIGLFQVKYYWGDKASLSLIGYSLTKLFIWMQQNPDKVVGLNFPGIGYGGLHRENIIPMLEEFGDKLIVFEKE